MTTSATENRRRPGVFLDRDDTLIRCEGLPPPPLPAAPGDVLDPAVVDLLPGVADALRELEARGFPLIVVTNQGGIARGGAPLGAVEAVNDRVRELLSPGAPWRGPISAFYACPFHPRGGVPRFTMEHAWRKPNPGMLLAASAEHGVDLSRSWMIGDAVRDVEAGIVAGIDPARCLRVGREGAFADLAAAAAHVIAASPIQ